MSNILCVCAIHYAHQKKWGKRLFMKRNGKRFYWAQGGAKQVSIFLFKVDGPERGVTLKGKNI
jgi:hypothetical protein